MAFRLTCSAMGPPTGVADGDRARIVHAAPYSRVVVESATPMNVGIRFGQRDGAEHSLAAIPLTA